MGLIKTIMVILIIWAVPKKLHASLNSLVLQETSVLFMNFPKRQRQIENAARSWDAAQCDASSAVRSVFIPSGCRANLSRRSVVKRRPAPN